MPRGRDFYQILGVDRNATAEKIKKAYKKLAVRYHPDRCVGKSEGEKAAAEAKFKDCAEAVETLSDPEKRSLYDRYGEDGVKAGGVPSSSAGFSGFPGGMGTSFSFSSSGDSGSAGMDALRAEEIFAKLFGGGVTGGKHGLMDDDDLFGGLMGDGVAGMMGGMGRRTRQRGAPKAKRIGLLDAGTVVQLHGLYQEELNGSVASVEEYVESKGRYTVRTQGAAGQPASVLSVRPQNVRQVLNGVARVVGTSQEALNGKIASAATFDAETRRYQCKGLREDGSVLSIKPENVRLPKDVTVKIEGVKTKPALNGRVGLIKDVEPERYVVQLNETEAVRLRFDCVAAC